MTDVASLREAGKSIPWRGGEPSPAEGRAGVSRTRGRGTAGEVQCIRMFAQQAPQVTGERKAGQEKNRDVFLGDKSEEQASKSR